MKITILGTGTSCGVPVIGCQCDTCRSNDPRDKRLRCSLLVEDEDTRVLIDCGPDFRQQILPQPVRRIDGILITHAHYDHMGGLDDIRPYCKFGDIHVYADPIARKGLLQMLPYCFEDNRYPGVPAINLHEIHHGQPLTIGSLDIMPVEVMHGKLPILGFRIGTFAYITDMKTIHDDQLPFLQGVETLLVNALRFDQPHHSHQLVDDAINFARSIGARRTLLTHLCHDTGPHAEASKRLPDGVELAFDGQILNM